MAQFTIIKNPKNVMFKHEVWYSGMAEGVDADGFRVEKEVCKPVDSFLTEQKAQEYITYQQQIRAFKGGR